LKLIFDMFQLTSSKM